MTLLSRAKSLATVGIAGFTSLVFLDSLRYKFTNHPNTQEIFGRLDAWTTSLGAPGLFAQTGLFSQYVIGTAELVAASLLLIGILPRFQKLQAVGSLIAVGVMTGAISFHLFTPLGIDPNNDGGSLFVAAIIVWSLTVLMLIIRRKDLTETFGAFTRSFAPLRA
ncbi:MAG: hypothetical protein AAF830_00995 [Pseudomonadota bacterium]